MQMFESKYYFPVGNGIRPFFGELLRHIEKKGENVGCEVMRTFLT
jgi:hypothetical protein